MKKLIQSIVSPLTVILIAAVLRLVPHTANFAPITAMALFGGVYLSRKWAFVIPLSAMIISDYLLLYINPFGTPVFNFTHIYPPQALIHDTIIAIYLSFIISGLVGLWLKKHKTATNIIFAAVFCSVQFFIISNFAVWTTGMYGRTLAGLWECYIAAIPFFRGTFIGDLTYSITFFGAYELAISQLFKKATVKVSS